MGETCTMITGHACDNEGNLTDDIECRRAASFRCKRLARHFICRQCYDRLADDPDLQADYETMS